MFDRVNIHQKKQAEIWTKMKIKRETEVSFLVQFVGNKAKERISKRVFQENKARQIFRKINISYPLIRARTCVSGGKKCLFFGKFGVLCFLETPILRFALLPYYRWAIYRNFTKLSLFWWAVKYFAESVDHYFLYCKGNEKKSDKQELEKEINPMLNGL